MTPHEALQAALRLWSALAEHPTCDFEAKVNLCTAQNNGARIHNHCPACEYVMQTYETLECSHCPVRQWAAESASTGRRLGCISVLYGEWEDLDDLDDLPHTIKERRALATKIRDLIASNLPQE